MSKEDIVKTPKREFRGIWIPAAIWKNKLLTIQQKVFLAEIDSLAGAKGCFASNEYFADFFGLSKSRVSNVIHSLEKADLITVDLIYKDGSKQVEKRILRPKGYERPHKIVFEKPTEDERPEEIKGFDKTLKEVIGYLNKRTGRDFKTSTEGTKRHVRARMREGFQVKDFVQVVDQKVEDWGVDLKMREYLRPETLFGSKFEGYLQKARTRPRAKFIGKPAKVIKHSDLFEPGKASGGE